MTASEVSEMWADWIADMGEWHLFGALTYDQRRRKFYESSLIIHPPGADVARAHVRTWLREGGKRVGRRIEAAVVALEYQRNGWPHFHPLLRLAGGLQGNELQELGGQWFQRHGYARLEQPRNQRDVAGYASKYLVKDLDRGDILFWPSHGALTSHQQSLPSTSQLPDRRRRQAIA